MSQEDIEPRILNLFVEIAPDVDAQKLKRSVAFRDQFDFDSMDTLNFAISLHRAFDIDIPETDYRQLSSLEKTVAYVDAALKKRQ